MLACRLHPELIYNFTYVAREPAIMISVREGPIEGPTVAGIVAAQECIKSRYGETRHGFYDC